VRHGFFKAQNAFTRMCSMVLQQSVRDVMTTPVLKVTPETPLQEAVALLSDHHISGLPVVNDQGQLIGELTEQDLMVRESGVDAGPYVMLLDSVIYLRNPLNWDKQVHQVLGTTVKDLMRRDHHSCNAELALPRAASLLHERSTQRLYVVDADQQPIGVITRGDVVRALASGQG
jgi:CBS domain-containing protein